jgi:hypothetical protein
MTKPHFTNENKYDTYIASAATRYGVPVSIVKGIIAQESGFNENARREEIHLSDASIGLMQILLKTANGVGYYGTPDGLLIPQVNIEYGTKFLGALYAKYRDIQQAVAAYNSGSGERFNTDAAHNGFCLARQQGQCVLWYQFKAGEFGNQPYVQSVIDYARNYGWTGPVPEVRGKIIRTPLNTSVASIPTPPEVNNLPQNPSTPERNVGGGGGNIGGVAIAIIAGTLWAILRNHVTRH